MHQREFFTTALLYIASGLSVIPIRTDGSKAPLLKEWKPFQFRRPTEDELREWFDNEAGYGIAIIGGAVSGFLEIFDCDAPHLFQAWCELVESLCPGLLIRLVIVLTPSGGFHVYYRSSEIEGNQKLAQQLIEVPEGTENGLWVDGQFVIIKTLLETRGQGGYVLAPGSPLNCHAARKPYVLLSGDFSNIPTITKQERAIMLDAARSFNKYVRPERIYQPSSTRRHLACTNRPGDDFNAKADWHSLLTSHGWKYVFTRGEVAYWRRPGKPAPGISATTNYEGSNLLYIFSTNAAPFEEKTAYSLFSAFTLLEYGGDFHASAKVLAGQGFGKLVKKKSKPPRLYPVLKPQQTFTLSKPLRPTNTTPLSKPSRPTTTTIINAEVRR